MSLRYKACAWELAAGIRSGRALWWEGCKGGAKEGGRVEKKGTGRRGWRLRDHQQQQ